MDEIRYCNAMNRKLVAQEDDPNQSTSWLTIEDRLFSNVLEKRTKQSRMENQDVRNNEQKTACRNVNATMIRALVW